MSPQDDSDVKIFGKPAEMADAGDLVELSSQLDRQRSNGNIAKARALGKQLAILEQESSSGIDLYDLLGDTDFPSATVHQVRILLVFIAQTTLHKKLATQLLSSCAVNAMYDKLIENAASFYDDISDGAAFTFYYLSLRRDKDVAGSIGENFAMLCGKDGDEEYKKLGTKIFTNATGLIEGIINEFNFE